MTRFGKLKPPSGNKNFIKVEPEQKVRGLLVGDPIEITKEFNGEKKWRFRINMVINENGAFVAKILEQGTSVYNQIKELEEDGWDLGSNLVVISRKGSGMQTEWTVTPDPKGALSAKQLEQIAAVALLDLEPKEASGGSHSDAGAEDAPF
jgi:hypothetical protein